MSSPIVGVTTIWSLTVGNALAANAVELVDVFVVVSTVSNTVSSENISGCSTFRGKLLLYLLSLLLLDPRVFLTAVPDELQSSCSKMVIRDLL